MLRIRHLFVEVSATDGRYGRALDFKDGLNIIRADNSMGKSTLMQAVVYALGLEGMFGPSQDVPLAHVVTDYLEHENGMSNVLEASVYLEIANADGNYLTTQRVIKGTKDRHLITVLEGRAVTGGGTLGKSEDYFVRERFAAVSERGFHRKLATFLGWDLPKVPRFNDVDCPLYMEAVFPLFYVEQKLGWGKLPARFPTYLGIRDTTRRAVEFVLGLDAYKIATEKSAVHDEIGRIRTQWSSLRAQTAKVVRPAAGIVNGVPPEPVVAWPPEIPPRITVPRGGVWISLDEYVTLLRTRLSDLESRVIPAAGEIDSKLQLELANLETELAERDATLGRLVEQVESDRSESAALEARIDAIEDDLRKHKDLTRLRKLGSTDGAEFTASVCPTCHQDMPESLLDTGRKTVPMSVEQNIEFLQEQSELFRAVLANARTSIEAHEVEVYSHRKETEDLRSRIRSVKETITSPGSTPSVEAITERLRIEQRIVQLDYVLENFRDAMAEFAQLSDEWKQVEERRMRLPKGSLSESDQSKVSALELSVRNQLQFYQMESLDPKTVSISRGDYEPEIERLNLSADVSASDLIRMQWAYLLGLLEVGRSFSTNHPGLLMMDEPQQQSVNDQSFRSMLEYAAGFKNHQLIVATSYESSDFLSFLAGIGAQIHDIRSRTITRI